MMPPADLNLVFVRFFFMVLLVKIVVFMVDPLFCFSLVSFAFTGVLQEIRRDITRKVWIFWEPRLCRGLGEASLSKHALDYVTTRGLTLAEV
jgi:hypothetical protein